MSLDPRSPDTGDFDGLFRELRDLGRRLEALEAPSGTQAYRTVAKLQLLVDNIQEQLDEYNASRWTNGQITEQIDAAVSTRLTQDQVDARIQIALASYFSGNVSIGGSLRVLGDAQIDGAVRAPGVRNTDLTSVSGRVVVWQGGTGDPRLGHT